MNSPTTPPYSATWLRQASPYINAHRGRTFVVLVPGEGIANANFINIVHDLVLLHSLGVKLVLVHGARPQIDARLAERGLSPKYHRGLRVTDPLAMRAVIDAVGALRIALEAKFSTDMARSPMQGARMRIVTGNLVVAKPLGVHDGVDFHYTGEVRRIDAAGMNELLDSRALILLSPMGYSPTGEVFNLACEEVARETAIALNADKLILCGSESGLLGADGQLVRQLRVSHAQPYIDLMESDYVGRLLRSAVLASKGGVRRCHIVSYRKDGALLNELFTRDGTGTLITQEQFESLRGATIDDVGGILNLIAPLENEGVLVRRSRELLEREIQRFCVIERDGLLIGCAALYPLPDAPAGELACLAVRPAYREGGRGEALLEDIEARARALGITHIYVLTTRTAHWFKERGFEEADVDALPESRAALFNWQRNSKVFRKALDPVLATES
ncbi:MAG: amino-acid N-acetyltransferase [Myxococcota bacterium]|nr:amino-acid N-acetyltransferase [Myxococcota bacterium]